MTLVRPPAPSLAHVVSRVWTMDQRGQRPYTPGAREHVLPTGAAYLAFLLSDDPLRIYESPADEQGRRLGSAVVGGARSTYYIRDVSAPSRSVGAELLPGAAERLLGASAAELAQRHTPLELLWRRDAGRARERLLEADGAQAQLDAFEAILAGRLRASPQLHPVVEYALHAFERIPEVRSVVRESGHSHRSFVALFRRYVGLSPKAYCRVLRFQRALEQASATGAAWADIAARAGYSDQAHLSRELRAFAGVTPSLYRKIAPQQPNHVPLLSS